MVVKILKNATIQKENTVGMVTHNEALGPMDKNNTESESSERDVIEKKKGGM
jgi:hypothetical protein